MTTELYIKNMVCDRCKTAINTLLAQHGISNPEIQLGRVSFEENSDFNLASFAHQLKENGFELIKNTDYQLTEHIKVCLIDFVSNQEAASNLSDYLKTQLHKDYTILSKTFKKIEGQTIEKYWIQLKIEKVKELIQMQQLSFSEIAYQLGYNSISHLSVQFKTITGMTMSNYQKAQQWNRSNLDKIL